MLKYAAYGIVFSEIPDEISLSIDISNCPFRCKGCHSPFLWKDEGIELTNRELFSLLTSNQGISCVLFAGGDSDPAEVNRLAQLIKHSSFIKVAWYSGNTELPKEINLSNFDYIKLGPYIEELGGLKNPNTNQRLYKIDNNKLIDITQTFWK